VTLADHRRKALQRGGTYARYLAASGGKGYLIYVSRGTLFAVPFDPEKLETSGSPMPVLQHVSYSAMFGSAKLSFSRTGTFVYRSQEMDASRVVIQWLDGDGKSQPLLDKPGLFVNPHFSPDGERLAVANDDARSGIWVYDIRRDTLSPLTGEKNGTSPVWTPDGRYIVYQAADGISFARSDGGSRPESLIQSKEFQHPSAFSPDGKTLAFYQSGPQGFELWTVPVEREGEKLKAGKPELFQGTSFGNRGATFSADGRWLAYGSNQSGSSQVYVRAFPDKGGHWQISSNGGTSPIFSRNGKDLFFYDPADDRIMVVSYSVKGDTFVTEKPRVWSGQSVALALSGAVGAQYDLAPDGKRIAVATYAGGSSQQDSGHVIFLENFIDELQRRIPLDGK
jgi:Tol biopolymer transport system component